MSRALTLNEAAAELRKTERWLKEWLAKNPVDEAGMPFYVPMGRTKTFELADINRIRETIRRGEQCRLKSIGVTASGIIAEQLAQMATDAVFGVPAKPRTKTSPRVRFPRSKSDTGTVISMALKRS
jgi:hypothetical protein